MVRMDRFKDSPPSDTEQVAQLRLHLRERSLSELVNKEIVEYDSEEGVVKEGSRFSKAWAEYQQ